MQEVFLLKCTSDDKDSLAGVIQCRYKYKLVVLSDDFYGQARLSVTSRLRWIPRNGLLSLKGSYSVSLIPFKVLSESFAHPS